MATTRSSVTAGAGPCVRWSEVLRRFSHPTVCVQAPVSAKSVRTPHVRRGRGVRADARARASVNQPCTACGGGATSGPRDRAEIPVAPASRSSGPLSRAFNWPVLWGRAGGLTWPRGLPGWMFREWTCPPTTKYRPPSCSCAPFTSWLTGLGQRPAARTGPAPFSRFRDGTTAATDARGFRLRSLHFRRDRDWLQSWEDGIRWMRWMGNTWSWSGA